MCDKTGRKKESEFGRKEGTSAQQHDNLLPFRSVTWKMEKEFITRKYQSRLDESAAEFG
jgi:hypothetical protein